MRAIHQPAVRILEVPAQKFQALSPVENVWQRHDQRPVGRQSASQPFERLGRLKEMLQYMTTDDAIESVALRQLETIEVADQHFVQARGGQRGFGLRESDADNPAIHLLFDLPAKCPGAAAHVQEPPGCLRHTRQNRLIQCFVDHHRSRRVALRASVILRDLLKHTKQRGEMSFHLELLGYFQCALL